MRAIVLSVLLLVGCNDPWASWANPPANDICPPSQILYSCPISVGCALGGPRSICPVTCCGSDPYSAQANCLLQFTSIQNARAVDPPGCTPVGTVTPQGDPVTVAVGAGAGGAPGAGGVPGAGGAPCACGL